MAPEAQRKVYDLFNLKVNNSALRDEFRLFDRSITQKLWAARYYHDSLLNLDIRKFWEQSVTTSIQSSGSNVISTPSQGLNLERYCSHVHLLLDGFFMNSMSALDMLAHQIFLLYDLQQKPSKVYIGTVKRKLAQFHPNSKLRKLLDEQMGQTWFDQFQQFRNCTTHESLIGYDKVEISYDPITGEVVGSKIRLPDYPKGRPIFTYSKRREATRYCQLILKKVNSLVTKVYESIWVDIRRANNILPMP
jgi:hypothetical protein